MKWLRYSGIWLGLVVNPFHWRLKWDRYSTDNVFENCLYLGPIWLRIIIDDGRW
jgi:hypothetical protein